MLIRDHITLFINGQGHDIFGDAVWMTLTDYLKSLRLTGTKVVCAEGDCGSCTVSIGRPRDGTLGYTTVCGCILRLFQLDGAHVITVEGLAYDGELNPVQNAMVKCNGAQCGFCTPGFVVTLHQLLQDGQKADADVRRKLTGNLCRCTGYDAILDAAKQCDTASIRPLNVLYPDTQTFAESHVAKVAGEPALIEYDGRVFYKPTTVADAVAFRAKHPTCVLIAGGTDLGVLMNKGKINPPILLSTAALPGFGDVIIEGDTIIAGGGATHEAVQRVLADAMPEYFDYLEYFGSPQIRQGGTLAGNLATGSPIGDSLPPLCVLNAEIELTGPAGTRRVNLNDFYTGYRTSVMKSDELITRVFIPKPKAGETLKLYKISKRRDLDISTFSAAILLKLAEGKIAGIRIAFGGVGPTVVRLRKTEAFLAGKPFSAETFDGAQAVVLSEITPISDVRGSADYRNLLGGNILRRLHAELSPTTSPTSNGKAH
ncbi:MAG: FAD binding domain-containing protein [Tepidisphaeraceae bacterium]